MLRKETTGPCNENFLRIIMAVKDVSKLGSILPPPPPISAKTVSELYFFYTVSVFEL
jgi:hypothetical protein